MSPPPIALVDEKPFRGEGDFLSTRHAAHVHIQELQAGSIVVSIALAVLAIDHVHGLLHLLHILSCAGIQHPLHHRLLGTQASSERSLQGRIGSETTVDFHQPTSTGQQADKGIIELVTGRMLDRLLFNAHYLLDLTKQVQVLELHAQRCQARTRGKMTFRWYDRFVTDDEPPLSSL